MCSLFTDGDWIESKDQSVQGVRLLQTGNVGVTEFVEKANNKKWVSDDTFDRLHCTEVLPGDVLISRLPEPAGRACIVPNLMNRMITAVDCTIVRTSQEFDSEYLVQYLSTSAHFHEVNNCLAGGTRQRISRSNLANFDISVPSQKTEQKAIGNLFNHLDNIITFHQRKFLRRYNRYQFAAIKFFCLFAHTWEQRKLREIVDRVTRKNQDLVSTLPLTISARYGLIDQNEFFDKRIASKDVSGYYLIYNGEFAYNKSTSNDAPWGAIKRLNRYENGVLSTLYIVFKIKNLTQTSSDFLAIYYDSNGWHKDVQAIAAEGARNHGLLNIAPNDFFETDLMIPQDIVEQQAIGDYFTNINNLITFHQRKSIILKDNFKAWEQRKLREVTDRYDNLRIPVAANLRVPGTTPYYGANGIQDYVSGFTHDGEFVLVAEDGANDLKNYPVKYVKGRIWVNNHAHVLQGKENISDNLFLSYSLNRADIESLLVGGGRAKLNAEIMMGIDILMPILKEQKRIGAYFSNMDNLITFHRRAYK